jgi:hypothetical protein
MKIFGLPLKACGGLLLAITCYGGPTVAEPIESIEKLAIEWAKARTERVKLESEWATERELIEPTMAALRERATTAEEKRDSLRAKTAREREELGTAETANAAVAAEMKAASARLQSLTSKLIALRPALPPRLSAALELPFKSITSSDLPVGDRMQLTMTVLNRCIQFNRAITCGEEAVTVDGEATPLVLEVIYWGLSHGYALDRAGGRVWFGSPAQNTWRWERRSEPAVTVARLIDIYNGKSDPAFVSAPAHLEHSDAETRSTP